MGEMSEFEKLFWKGSPPAVNIRISHAVKLEYEIAREWWLKALETIGKDNRILTGEACEHKELCKCDIAKALTFYADPDTYFAIGFFPDPPCGEFINDFDEEKKPGALARKTFEIQRLKIRFNKILKKIEEADAINDKEKAAAHHAERREVKAELKKLGVEVHS